MAKEFFWPVFGCFIALWYLFAAIPGLLHRGGMDFSGAYTSMVVASALLTLLASWLWRRPVAVVPSLGIVVYLIYGLVINKGIPWNEALAVAALACLLVGLLLSADRQNRLMGKLPRCIAMGLKGSLAMLVIHWGLTEGHIIMGAPFGVTMLGSMADPAVYVSVVGLLAAGLLWSGHCRAALPLGLLAGVLLALLQGFWAVPAAPFMEPAGLDKTALKLNFSQLGNLLLPLLVLCLVIFSEIVGTLTALGANVRAANGRVNNLPEACERLPAAAIALGSIPAALLGCFPLAPAIENTIMAADNETEDNTLAENVVQEPLNKADDTPAALHRKTASGYGLKHICLLPALLLLLLPLAPLVKALAEFPAATAGAMLMSGIIMLFKLELNLSGNRGEALTVMSMLIVSAISADMTAAFLTGLFMYIATRTIMKRMIG